MNAPLDGPIRSCGADILYKPISQKDKHRLHQFGKKVLTGIKYAPHTRGGWTRDLPIAGWVDLEKNVASEVHVKKFKL